MNVHLLKKPKEKCLAGMKILVREGSAARGMLRKYSSGTCQRTKFMHIL